MSNATSSQPAIKFSAEHVAWQAADPVAVAAWYVKHLGFEIVRQGPAPVHMHFIADATRRLVIEIYNNPKASVPDYRTYDPLHLHVAFAVENPAAARDYLLANGATLAADLENLPNGDQIIMLRDPWGFAVQVLKRAKPML
ncbi:50S ribosomal protein L14 [Opitutaceae bacterium TAV5]|nr:50S ribosomal protein L14 [Opitutaceae bacterium TAV5]